MVATTRTARRHMTSAELRTWRALIDTTADLRRILGAQLQESSLSPADYAVLLALSETTDHRLRPSRLAAMIDWERSRLSHHLRRMERRGLVRREECSTDSRGTMVSLTPEGAHAFRHATAPHLRAIKRYFADALTPEQCDALSEILDAIRRHLPGSTQRPGRQP